MIFLFPLFILEFIISLKVGIEIGVIYSLLWILSTMFIGVILIKNSHIALFSGADQLFNQKFTIQRFHDSAISYLMGSLLIFIPGVLSDSFGLILLIYTLYLHFVAKISPKKQNNQFNQKKENDDVIDVEVISSDSDRLSKS
jgi:UPF0716 family protein affecting phage T7 exclusion